MNCEWWVPGHSCWMCREFVRDWDAAHAEKTARESRNRPECGDAMCRWGRSGGPPKFQVVLERKPIEHGAGVPPDPALDPDRIAAGARAEKAKFNHRLALDDELYGWNLDGVE